MLNIVMAFTSLFLTIIYTDEIPIYNDDETRDIVYKFNTDDESWTDISAGLPYTKAVNAVSIINDQIYLSFYEGFIYHSKINANSTHWEKELFLKTQEISDIKKGKGGAYILSQTYGFYQKVAPTDFWLPLYRSLNDKSVRSFLELSDRETIISSNQGVYKSKDGSQTWKHVFNQEAVFNLIEHNGVILGNTNKGLIRSVDGGDTWTWSFSEDRSQLKTIVFKDKFLTLNRTNAFNKNDEKTKIDTESILKISSDGGQSWKLVNGGTPTPLLYDIEVLGEDIYGSNSNGILKSEDQGKTWKYILKHKEDKRLKLISDDVHIYAIKIIEGC